VKAEVGGIESWYDLVDVTDGMVSFRATAVFESDGVRLVSESTLRFRTRDEVSATLAAAGYRVEEVRDAPDRPGREMVFVACRVE
jgi:hypothetical protein